MEYKHENGALRVMLTGDIDHHSAGRLCREMDLHIASARPREVILDFSGVSFMDSSGLAVAVGRKRFCDSIGADMCIVGCGGYPEKILKMAGADRLICFKEENNENR